MVVSILGCGWLGMALARDLVKNGIQVKGSGTSAEKLIILNAAGISGYIIKIGDGPVLYADSDFWNCDVLIIASNVKLAQNPGYLAGLKRIMVIPAVKNIKKLIFLSSISVYGEPNSTVDEDSALAPNTPSALSLVELEALFSDVPQALVLRLGGLVGPGRMPGSFFAGKKDVPNGGAPINLIHLTDCVGLCKLLINAASIPKYLNAVAPDHPEKGNFYYLAAAKQGLSLPEFLEEKNQWKIVNSRYIDELGYQFEVNDWRSWIA
jgi:nucleoside-diphosphate-sugar epimerase